MKSIKELQAEIEVIYQELEERRLAEQEAVEQELDFNSIFSKAECYAIEDHPLKKADEHTQSMYLLMLFSVAVLDNTTFDDSILTICRIAHGMKFQGDLQTLFTTAQQMNFDKLDECTRLFFNNGRRLLLMMKSMLVTAKFTVGKEKAMQYIAELCVLLKLTKEQVIFVANFARAVATNDIHEYKCNVDNQFNVFDCYLEMFAEQLECELIYVKPNQLNKADSSNVVFRISNYVSYNDIIINYDIATHGTNSNGKEGYLMRTSVFIGWGLTDLKYKIACPEDGIPVNVHLKKAWIHYKDIGNIPLAVSINKTSKTYLFFTEEKCTKFAHKKYDEELKRLNCRTYDEKIISSLF